MKFQKISSEKRLLAKLPLASRFVPETETYFVRIGVLCSLQEATYLLKNLNQLAESGVKP